MKNKKGQVISEINPIKPKRGKWWILIIVLVVIILILYFGFSMFINSQKLKVVKECLAYFPSTTEKDINPYLDCVKKIALERNSVYLCQTLNDIGYSDSNCIISLAEKNSNINICDKIKGSSKESFKIMCSGAVKKSQDFCNSYDDAYKTICLLGVAKATSDVALCEKINPRMCLNEIALKDQNPEICKEWLKISGEGNQFEVDPCLYAVGIKKGDVNICYTINNSQKKNECIFNVAINTKQESLCNTSACFSRVAILKEDTNICNDVKGSGISFQSSYNSPNSFDSTEKDDCLMCIALSKEDSSICDKVSSDNKNKCLDILDSSKKKIKDSQVKVGQVNSCMFADFCQIPIKDYCMHYNLV